MVMVVEEEVYEAEMQAEERGKEEVVEEKDGKEEARMVVKMKEMVVQWRWKR